MRIFKRIMFVILTLVAAIVVATLIVINQPQFGQPPSGEDLSRISTSPTYKNGSFENLGAVKMTMNVRHIFKILKAYTNQPEGKVPDSLEILHPDVSHLGQQADSVTALTWFGHSAFVLEMQGKVILLDPMFGPAAAPFSFQVKRFSNDLPIDIGELPEIDAVVFSHDHYDHLDYPTIMQIKDKVKHYYVPLGLGSHLKHWGVDPDAITELDWWQTAQIDEIELVCTPAQHFSGRSLNDGGKTLWSSWVIRNQYASLYFSGDSGYFKEFKTIGEKYGPFDLAMIECGQYNALWKEIHMMPEESAMAGKDLKANAIMPIHWAMFELALHTWVEPANRVAAKARELDINLFTPKIGQRFEVNPLPETHDWWNQM